jgi:hypothetical protein
MWPVFSGFLKTQHPVHFQWIFDLPDGGGRLLRIREGHAKPPTKIRFYGSLGSNILSSGKNQIEKNPPDTCTYKLKMLI